MCVEVRILQWSDKLTLELCIFGGGVIEIHPQQ